MRLAGFETLYGDEGGRRTPYLTRFWLGRLRLHVFHRGDADPDCHDHPWNFWTFPLTSYVEEVVRGLTIGEINTGEFRADNWNGGRIVERKIVPALRWSFRAAEHTHRVLGRFDEWATLELASAGFIAGSGRVAPQVKPGRIVTIVWLGRSRRKWGFLKNRDGRWCWMPWRDYVLGTGKHAPCEPSDMGGQS
jgi:hypothetical protein